MWQTEHVCVPGMGMWLFGSVVGVARLAPNPLLRRLAGLYVLAFRNTPLLLQMILWYALLQTLPPVRQAVRPRLGRRSAVSTRFA